LNRNDPLGDRRGLKKTIHYADTVIDSAQTARCSGQFNLRDAGSPGTKVREAAGKSIDDSNLMFALPSCWRPERRGLSL
jgi:hypothetical protein